MGLYQLHHKFAPKHIVPLTSCIRALYILYHIHVPLLVEEVARVDCRVLKELLDHLVLGLEMLDNHLALTWYQLKGILPTQVRDDALLLQITQLYVAHHFVPTIELSPLVYNLALEQHSLFVRVTEAASTIVCHVELVYLNNLRVGNSHNLHLGNTSALFQIDSPIVEGNHKINI